MNDQQKIALLRDALKDAADKLDHYASKQSARRMTATAGTGKRERPFVANKSAGQHYPAVAGALAYSQTALAKTA